MVILTDSRERESSHILDWFDKKNIQHKVKALGNGDYSFYIPANSDLNIERDLYFDKEIMIERKASLEELSNNLTTARTRFEEEMATYKGKKYLLIENANYSDIVSQNYTSKFSPKAYLASIHTFNHRYNLEVVFMPKKECSPVWIYGTFTYYLKNIMR
jgi:ERCC4-type nuclease